MKNKRLGQEGFTFIELMVVASITVILGIFGIAGFNNYNKVQVLQNTANELITTLNLARSRASSQVKLCNSPIQVLEGYSIDISIVNKTYTLKSRCSGDVKEINQKKLPNDVSFKNTSKTSFFFPIIAGGVEEAGYITLVEKSGLERNIEVSPFGGISMQLTPTVFPTNTPVPSALPTSTPIPPTPTPLPTATPTPLPTPTPKPAEIPIKNNIASENIAQQGGGHGNTQGYRFKPIVNGKIVALWDYSWCNYPDCATEYGQKYIKLWLDNGTLLAVRGVYSGGSWRRSEFFSPPIVVTANTWYRVSTYLPTYPNGWSYAFWGYYAGASFPINYGNIYIEGSYYSAGDVFPQFSYGANFYGLADIEFIPD